MLYREQRIDPHDRFAAVRAQNVQELTSRARARLVAGIEDADAKGQFGRESSKDDIAALVIGCGEQVDQSDPLTAPHHRADAGSVCRLAQDVRHGTDIGQRAVR